MEITREDPTAIRIPKRLRELNPAKVKQLAESMAAIGMHHPVMIWRPTAGDLELVVGRHRVQAACDLGWKWIDTIDAKGMTDIDRQLWEIDENLMRAELTTAEHADHLARRKKLWIEREEIQVAQVEPPEKSAGYKSPPKQKKGFAAETADATGLSKATINRAVSRGEEIPEDVLDQIKGTKLDTGVYLDSLKSLEPEEQLLKVKTNLAGSPAAMVDAEIRAWNRACAARGKALQTVKQAWRRASAEDRRRIKAWVLEQETPISDD